MTKSIELFDQFFKENKISQIIPLKENFNRGLFVYRAQQEDYQVLIKIVSKKNTQKIITLQKEYVVNKLLNDEKIFLFKVNKILELDEYKCLIREFIEGKSLIGQTNSVKSASELFGYDLLRDDLTMEDDYLISQIVQVIRKIQKHKYEVPEGYEHLFKARIDSGIENYKIALIEEKLLIGLDDCVSFYEREKREYLSNRVFCVGDLVPANIIILDNQKVIFIDLEWACFDNQTMDVSYLWLFLWRHPQLQKLLIDNFVTQEMQKDFCLSTIRQIMAWYSTNLENLSEEAILRYKSHIWTKYLLAAGQSFDKLINTKV